MPALQAESHHSCSHSNEAVAVVVVQLVLTTTAAVRRPPTALLQAVRRRCRVLIAQELPCRPNAPQSFAHSLVLPVCRCCWQCRGLELVSSCWAAVGLGEQQWGAQGVAVGSSQSGTRCC